MHDLVLVGGGPVGLALVHALADSGLSVALVEARETLSAEDPRVIALAQGSRLILERIRVWPHLAAQATAIETIHVSRQGGFGRAELSAAEAGVPALGYCVEYGALYAALAAGLPGGAIELVTGARVVGLAPGAEGGEIQYLRAGSTHRLAARLIVVADGGKGLPMALGAYKDYRQSALLARVRCERPIPGRAFERFTAEGPIALLPLGDEYALVWTTPARALETRMRLSDAEFLQGLTDAFAGRLGRFTACGPRAAFPLRLMQALEDGRPGLVRIGNAAQSLHPVAGQGFNLGLRDAWMLAQAVLDAPVDTLGSAGFIAAHLARRRRDVLGGIGMTDLLVDAFADRLPTGLAPLRGLALAALDLTPPLKRLFARKMMFGMQAW